MNFVIPQYEVQEATKADSTLKCLAETIYMEHWKFVTRRQMRFQFEGADYAELCELCGNCVTICL